jgi:tRNA pseudouridine38-40 synthase
MHDFASFCRRKPNATTIREVRDIQIKRNPLEENIVEVELLADAFCHNMVRSIVGALIAAGEGKASPDDVAEKLAKRTRVGSYKVQPAQGLTLIEIGYPADDELEAQAERARNMRTLDEN